MPRAINHSLATPPGSPPPAPGPSIAGGAEGPPAERRGRRDEQSSACPPPPAAPAWTSAPWRCSPSPWPSSPSRRVSELRPLAPLLPGARPGAMVPRKPRLFPARLAAAPLSRLGLLPRLRCAWRARAMAVLSWKQTGSHSSLSSIPPWLFSKSWPKRSSLPNSPQIEVVWGKTVNSARSAGRWFGCKICVSTFPLTEKPQP